MRFVLSACRSVSYAFSFCTGQRFLMKIKLLNLDLESTINLEEFAAKRRKFWGINLGNTSPEAAFFPRESDTQKTFKTLFGSEQNPAANKKN